MERRIEAGRVVRLAALDVLADHVAGLLGGDAGLLAQPAQGLGWRGQGRRRVEVHDEPLRAFLGLAAAEAEASSPTAEAGGWKDFEPLGRRQGFQGLSQQLPHEQVADRVQRPQVLLLAAAEQGVDDLEQQVFQEFGVALVSARRDQQLPLAAGAVLDRVQQVRLARALVAQHGNDLGVHARRGAVQIDDVEQLLAFTAKQLGDVVEGANLVIGIAGEVVAERIAGPAQLFQSPFRQRPHGNSSH